MAQDNTDLLVLTSEIVAAYLSNNNVRADEVPQLIRTVRSTLIQENAPEPEAAPEPEQAKLTAGQIRKSIRPDALISFIDGKPYKTLKRHLTRHGFSIQEYKAKYGLPKDYPSVAPEYSARRSEMAKSLGLGAQGRGARAAGAAGPAAEPDSDSASAAPKRRGRKPAAASE